MITGRRREKEKNIDAGRKKKRQVDVPKKLGKLNGWHEKLQKKKKFVRLVNEMPSVMLRWNVLLVYDVNQLEPGSIRVMNVHARALLMRYGREREGIVRKGTLIVEWEK